MNIKPSEHRKKYPELYKHRWVNGFAVFFKYNMSGFVIPEIAILLIAQKYKDKTFEQVAEEIGHHVYVGHDGNNTVLLEISKD